MNMIKSYQHYMGQLSEMIFLLLLLLLPYPTYVFQPVWIAWLIAWGLEGRLFFPRQWQWRRALPASLFLILLIWELISLLWAPDKSAGWAELGRHINFLSLAVIPMVGISQSYKPKRMEYALILGAVIAVPVYILIQKCAFLYVIEWTGNPDVGPWWIPNGRPLLLMFKHQGYFCLIQLAAICCLFHRWRDIQSDLGSFRAWVAIIVCLSISLTGILLTVQRMALIVLIVLVIFFAIRMAQKRWVKSLILSLSIAITLTFTFLHPRMQELMHPDTYLQYNEQVNDVAYNNARIAIWHTIFQQASDFSAYGLGVNNACPYLATQYEQKGWTLFLQNRYGPHSQYFALWMDLGLLAMLLFIVAWWSLPLFFKRQRNFAWAVTLLLGISMITESLFGRLDGVITVCVLLIILLSNEYYEDTNSLE